MQTQATDGAPPRFYQLILQQDLLGGWNLLRQYGITGLAGTQRRKHFTSLPQAMDALAQARDEQLAKGYRITFTQGQAA